MVTYTRFRGLSWLALVLAFGVVVLGAYVRLTDAGLGCPDWPGCYGHLTVPEQGSELDTVSQTYPRPLEAGKAWREMIHRYFAGTLGLVIFVLGLIAWRDRNWPGQPCVLPTVLVGLVIFQALLGMWTVTWQLNPIVVTTHLLGGMTTFALLAWLVLRQGDYSQVQETAASLGWLRPWALLGLGIVAIQIALGGWTSANYAALACSEFPMCQGQWWPPMDFQAGFTVWQGLDLNYEGGVLDNPARTAIHMAHRIGALVTFLYIGGLAGLLLRYGSTSRARILGRAIWGLLLIQLALGITNVTLYLPLATAVAHNAGAALLLLGLVVLNHHLYLPRRIPQLVEDGCYTGSAIH